MFVVKMAHPSTYSTLRRHMEWVVSFKQYLLQPPFPRDILSKARALGIKIAVYREPPNYLINLLNNAYNVITKL